MGVSEDKYTSRRSEPKPTTTSYKKQKRKAI